MLRHKTSYNLLLFWHKYCKLSWANTDTCSPLSSNFLVIMPLSFLWTLWTLLLLLLLSVNSLSYSRLISTCLNANLYIEASKKLFSDIIHTISLDCPISGMLCHLLENSARGNMPPIGWGLIHCTNDSTSLGIASSFWWFLIRLMLPRCF